jgi:hypothetical protein
MAREDARAACEGLTAEQIWARPGGVAAVGFHLRHIPGSVERLLTYALGKELTEAQLAELKTEGEPGPVPLDEFEARLLHLGEAVKTIDPATMAEARGVGRKKLPTTVGGLLIHIAEHTQRHVGQLVTTAKIVSAS